MAQKNTYTVNVGNVGNIEYTSKKLALDCYNTYVTQSKDMYGRASGEDVYLFQNDEIIKEYYGTLHENED